MITGQLVQYKIVVKVLANRLKLFLLHIILNTQSAFVLGRLIIDNVLIAFELMHYLSRKRHGDSNFMFPELDISKAYHHIN